MSRGRLLQKAAVPAYLQQFDGRPDERQASGQSLWRSAAALIEVLIAFALVHLCWRSFKHFVWLGKIETSAGLNYSAGLIMILFTIAAARFHGRKLTEFGINLRDWRYNLNLGILWGVVPPVSLLIVVWLSGFRPADRVRPGTPWSLALIGSGIALACALVLLWMLRKRRAYLAAVKWPVSITALLVLCSLPVAAACSRHQPVALMIGTVGWLLIGAGIGEEMFFRGYVQTRLDLALGKPLEFLGLQFGIGLVASAILFGFVHALNTVDYFRGQYHFNWPSGLFNCFVGVAYSVMREKTGSLFPSAVAHGLSDVLGRLGG